MKILVATTNSGKKREFQALLNIPEVEWLSLSDLPEFQEVEETGNTFAENASIKACGYAKQTGLWTVADDSGLEIDALDGAPGIHSARFSGTHKVHDDKQLIDHENTEKALALLEGVPNEKRTARFRCCLCLASPDEVLAQTDGVFEGIISTEKRGTNGFGYDPILYIPEKGKTVAQMQSYEKNSISHRAKAVMKLKPILEKMLRK
ncbi:Non-canonical purine NTP pyrophosphatase [Limihaloglobus sulfuriphilus]|uniref:dITP/XTP pyrophosphatase n=1 Tax=Limihaloglobus sulfuriphilus TaxID=1851148 RepID=A0A1Q2MC20_9BACT|nr:XTP/dITP diphosphatase [Limihaloglobus sulfuriphilus]AQQ70209.1 Non-canonical purine NTP pyrophosphatase [Limihaloglobus sulfuriphilus]